jgi:YgiT-type zinc finger domain-containing protein
MGTRLPDKEIDVRCVICRLGETKTGKTTITLERDRLTLVVKGVPAQVCENCGEAYVDEQTTAQLLASAEQAARAGVQVEVREFVAA